MKKARAKILREYEQKKSEIKNRLNDFKKIPKKEYFKELTFCILTPQSNAQRCWEAVENLFKEKELNEKNVAQILRTKTRFHNNKTRYVLETQKNWKNIQRQLQQKNVEETRNWLAENVNGIGLKEASHFLRNIGRSNNQIAILDRHILKNIHELGVISTPNVKNKKDYFEKEKKFLACAEKIKIPADELDLLWWSKENGEIFK